MQSKTPFQLHQMDPQVADHPGVTLHAWMAREKISVLSVAKAAGIDRTKIRRFLIGDSVLTAEVAVALAYVLDTPNAYELMRWYGAWSVYHYLKSVTHPTL